MVEAEGESLQVHEEVLVEMGVEGAVVSLDVEQAVEEVQALVVEVHFPLLTKSLQH